MPMASIGNEHEAIGNAWHRSVTNRVSTTDPDEIRLSDNMALRSASIEPFQNNSQSLHMCADETLLFQTR